MITEDYVSFEVAELLKEKGFDENTPCKYAGKEGATEEWYDDYRERMVRFNLDEGYLIEPLTEPQDKYCVYGDTIPAPSLALAMKWLRELKRCIIVIIPKWFTPYGCAKYAYSIWADDNLEIDGETNKDTEYDTYEKTCEAAIKYCLENLI